MENVFFFFLLTRFTSIPIPPVHGLVVNALDWRADNPGSNIHVNCIVPSTL